MDALQAELRRECSLHLHLSFLDAVAAAVPGGLAGLPLEQQMQHVLAHFLTADMNTAGLGCLPADIQVTTLPGALTISWESCLVQALERQSGAQTWHKRSLAGRFVLQVDEVCNVAAPAKQRCALLRTPRAEPSTGTLTAGCAASGMRGRLRACSSST